MYSIWKGNFHLLFALSPVGWAKNRPEKFELAWGQSAGRDSNGICDNNFLKIWIYVFKYLS